MKESKSRPLLMRLVARPLVVALVVVFGQARLLAQDIVLADFEEANYVWLPGGNWTATGTAFGNGPAHGTLTNQGTVDGYLGNGFVDSYLNGDASTGTLTSPPFVIQKKYIKFLLGGGNWRGQTCVNLLINGQIVRSAVGMGDREHLDWLQWNVGSFTNQTAQIQIVDSSVAGWGHINLDQIVETDTSLSSIILPNQQYLNIPIRTGAPKHLVELIQEGLVVREMNVELADTATNFYAFMDLTLFQGQELVVRVDSQLATSNQLAAYFIQTNSILTQTPIYGESFRPLYHYTARRGWINDANGMMYYNGVYHFFYQHNPYGWLWDNMHWGHAVSTDLVHWTELPEALYPDNLGVEFSGSGVVDFNNSAGFGTNALLAFYCSAGSLNRMSAGQPSTQCLACSLDQGQTWAKYTNNPVVPNIAAGNRDPKVIWYAPGNKWVMVIFLINNDFAILSSTDLRHWTQTSTFTFPGAYECPELFQLPVDGNTNNMKWVFYTNLGHYYVGLFDGNTFTPQYGPFTLPKAANFWAAQTFDNMPVSDGRRILMSNGSQSYPGMPFNQPVTFPVELTLVTSGGTPVLYANPVRELALLRNSTNSWNSEPLVSGSNVLSGYAGEACELDAQIQPGSASQVTFMLRGEQIVYDNIGHQITASGLNQPLLPTNGVIHLHFLVDRGIIELYANDGLLYMPLNVTPSSGPQPLSLVATGPGAQINSLNLYNLSPAWSYPASGPGPTIITQPAPVTAMVGGGATFGVTAIGTGPLSYQWRSNGQPIPGATNGYLSFFPVSGTNGNYDVIVSNSGGSVTSSVVPLTLQAPYAVALWSMESQIQAPNNSGTPTYNGIADSETNVGQGIYTTGSLPAAIDDLITFNGLTNGPVTLSSNVAPSAMFVNGHSAGNFSYNAEAVSNVDGCLFFPQDQYGDEMDFTSAFSIEMFFKTDGNRSASGPMQLISQGTDAGQTFRYGITMNEAAPGGVRFTIANSQLAQSNVVDLTTANYADGQWHYLLAVCDPLGGSNGQMRITLVNQDQTAAGATNNLQSGFLPLPSQNNGNMFIGRNSYALSQTPRTFMGLVDEVQIYAGVVPDSQRIGRIPSIDGYSDIVLADFEETNYAWLPGGNWTVTGNCFGTGPAQGTLPNQQNVAGYMGNGLVNTFVGGDGSTGTLLSPPFTITRKYIKFLIGAGNHRGQTCINLLLGGQVVRSAVGMGDRESLDWLQWDVGAYTNQTAQLQIVDSYTGGWGHVNVDQITETETPIAGTIVANQHYLNLPASFNGTGHLVEIVKEGLVVQEFTMNLVTNGTPDFYDFLDLTQYQGQELTVRIDSELAGSNQLASLIQSSNVVTTVPIYQETTRPIYHISARRGYINDPNGMVCYNGVYHVCFQHNPYQLQNGNHCWGHVASTDLVHWTELQDELYPDWLGTCISGGAAVDWDNSAGFGTNAVIDMFTSAGGLVRMSDGQPFAQSLAYSLDGTNFTKYPGNPVLGPQRTASDHDPRPLWYAPGNEWIMVLYYNDGTHTYGFFSSPDLKNWTHQSDFTLPNQAEVPEFFQLPLDGNTNNMKWIFYGGAGGYEVGTFDGHAFTPQTGYLSIRGGNNFAAAQTFCNIPASDGRKILIANTPNEYPGMPFDCTLTFPVQLTLQTTAGTPLIYANPVNEIVNLRVSTNSWPSQVMANGVNIMAGSTGEAFELGAQFSPGVSTNVTFTLGGTAVIYNCRSQQLSCEGITNGLSPINGVITLRMLVDRGMLEIFGNNGLLYMSMATTPVAGPWPLSLVAGGNGAQLNSLSLYNLGSAWPAAPPYISSQPGPATAVNLGGAASFSVTAGSTTLPLFYQWYGNGQAIAGATNSTLSVFPVAATNAGYYVVVSNAAGSVTSSPAPLTVIAPYQVACWSMESQITAPNNAGVPTFAGVADSATSTGQGIYTTGSLAAAIDDLITFNGLSGGPVTLSTNVAPASMFVNGHTPGSHSYNAEAISNVDGALFFPQDQYGDEMDFTGPFSMEMFFRTDGNRSASGVMQLISQGTDTGQVFRYGINVNESAPGGVRFKIANSNLNQTNFVDLTGANYADGQWHYLLAVCDTLSGANGQMRLTIVNQDGSQAGFTNSLTAGFLPLPTQDNGNMFLGRNTYPVGVNPATFLGFIDEVQITAGVVSDNSRIGRIPSVDNHIQIKGASYGTNGVSFQWAGAAANNFLVQWVSQLGATWQTIATLPGSNGPNSFMDTNTNRLIFATGFYRILSE
jgi:fructan beta-fructosidase